MDNPVSDNNFASPEEYYNTIRVEDYYDKIHRATWARRVSGALAGATLGIVAGALIGAVAAFIPPLLVAIGVAGTAGVVLPTLATAVASSAAMCAGAGAFVGILMNTDVGSNAASVAAGLEEREKRDKRAKIQEACLDKDGNALKVAVDHTLADPNINKPAKLFSWKVAAITGALGVVFGVVVALNPVAASVAALLSFKAGTVAGAISSGAVFGMFGSLIGIKNSYITNKVNNFYFKIITEQYFQKGPAQEVAKQPEVALSQSSALEQDRAIAESIIHESDAKSFAERQKSFSISNIISGVDKDSETVLTR